MKRKRDPNRSSVASQAQFQSDNKGRDHLSGYLRRSACSAAAGLGAFGLAAQCSAGVVYVDPPDFGRSGSNATHDFRWVSPNGYGYGLSWGIDILQDGGSNDVGLFRGYGYGGYLIARTDQVGYGYYYGYGGFNVYGSGQVALLTNDTELPDTGGTPSAPKIALQGFSAGQIIGDGNDFDALTSGQNVMRDGYETGDWEAGNGVPSYIGFKVDINNDTAYDGFGWIEVIVNDPDPLDSGNRPDVTVTRWAYTDDGSPIAAGAVPEPGTLALLAAGLGAMAIGQRRKSA